MGTMINVSGLWLAEDKNGDRYMAGNCGLLRFWIFKNKKKRGDNDPDYFLRVTQNERPPRREESDEEDILKGDGESL